MMGFRAGLGYLIAVITGLVVEWQAGKHGNDLLTPLARPSSLPLVEEGGARRRTLWERISAISETSLHDFVDITVFLILGALLAATVRQFMTPGGIAELSTNNILLAILFMMGLAVVLCLCSEADAFVAASFVTLKPAAKLAFLVLGPMLDFKLFLLYTRVFRPRLIWIIYAAVLSQVFIYSFVVHLVWEKKAPDWTNPVRPLGKPPAPESLESATRVWGLLAAPAVPGGVGVFTPIPAIAALAAEDSTAKPVDVTFFTLELAPLNATTQHYYESKLVRLTGRYTPMSDTSFTLVRYRYTCCGADAIPLKAEVSLGPELKLKLPVNDLASKWVRVTGRVKFEKRPSGNSVYTRIILHPTESQPLGKLIEVLPEDPNPYEY
jgi:hypothetical protein